MVTHKKLRTCEEKCILEYKNQACDGSTSTCFGLGLVHFIFCSFYFMFLAPTLWFMLLDGAAIFKELEGL